MSTIPLRLPTQTVIGKDGQVASARLMNGYAEQIERDGKAEYVIYAVPGLTRFDDGVLVNGIERGMIQLDDNSLIAILGNQVTKVDTAGHLIVIGTIVGSGRCTLAKDRSIPNEIAIVTDTGQYYLITGGDTVSEISNPNLPTPNSVGYLAGRFLYAIPDGRVFASAIDDGSTIGAASFDVANSNSDGNVRVYPYGGYLYVFGKVTTEIWAPDAGLSNAPFPYSNTQNTMTLGCLAPHSIAELDNGLVWVDDNGVVRYGLSQNARRISTHTVERAIAGLSDIDKAGIVGSVVTFEGHKVYNLTSPQWTFCYDIAGPSQVGGNWTERKSHDLPGWRVSAAVQFAGKYILGDNATAQLYYLDPSNFTEDGDILELEAWCGVSHRYPGQMIVDALKVDIVGGVGLTNGTGPDGDPKLMIDYSDNGGKVFQGERLVSIGKIGEYGKTIETFMWGLVREKGRIWRFRASAAVLRGIIQANLTARPVRG